MREGWVAEREARVSKISLELSKSLGVVEERGRAIEWLAEKKRQDNDKHAEEMEFAKQDRSCHAEVLELRKQLNTLSEKKLSADERRHWKSAKGRKELSG